MSIKEIEQKLMNPSKISLEEIWQLKRELALLRKQKRAEELKLAKQKNLNLRRK